MSPHYKGIANILNPVPRFINTLSYYVNNHQFDLIAWSPPLFRIQTPDGLALCGAMNASMPGSCADVNGQPHAVDVALLQYVLTEAQRQMRIRARLAVAAIAGGLMLSSCASLNVNAIPVPGSNYRGGYDIIIEFSNVLNLPDRAKVVMDGTKVGVRDEGTLDGHGVDVTSHIDRDVVVPSNIHAVLQQATVLGDTYVALERAPDD